ncbi:MAG: NUMOD3 domain-containing DNA-binding protein [Candidatus Hodarchaeota archaeon]
MSDKNNLRCIDCHKKIGRNAKRCKHCASLWRIKKYGNPMKGKHHSKKTKEKIRKKTQKSLHKHHKDLNKENNKKNNILYLSRKDHTKLHSLLKEYSVSKLSKKQIIIFTNRLLKEGKIKNVYRS